MENRLEEVDNLLADPPEHIRFMQKKKAMGIMHPHNDVIVTTVVSGRPALTEISNR